MAVLVEVVVARENAVAAGCSEVHVAENPKGVVVGEGVDVEAGSAGIAAFDSKAAVDSETPAGSKSSKTR